MNKMREYERGREDGLTLALHQIGQQEFEKTHTREEFMNIFGRNYL